MKLRGQDLDVVPAGQLRALHSHRGRVAVVAPLFQPEARKVLDLPHLVLFRHRVGVGKLPEIGLPVERLGMILVPRRNLIGIDDHVSVLDPMRELVESFRVVVFRDAGIDAEIPPVHTADQVVAREMTVSHEGTPVLAAPVEHRDFILSVTGHDEIDILDESGDRLSDLEFGEGGDGCLAHGRSFGFTETMPGGLNSCSRLHQLRAEIRSFLTAN